MTEISKLSINIKDSGIRFNLSTDREQELRQQKYKFGFSDSHLERLFIIEPIPVLWKMDNKKVGQTQYYE